MSIRPYFQSGDVIIYHGDCQQILPAIGMVDIVITSPPYNTLAGIGKAKPTGMRRYHRAPGGYCRDNWAEKVAGGYADDLPEGKYQEWLRWIIQMCLEHARGLVWVNHKVRYRDGIALHPVRFLPFPIYSEIIWSRGGSLALNCRRYAPSHEVILGFGRPHVWDDCQNQMCTVWNLPIRVNSEHPAPFPIDLPVRLIRSSTRPNDTVLDPFVGSGTTLVAAYKLGRRSIGIEREERFAEMAVKNVRNAQRSLFRMHPDPVKFSRRKRLLSRDGKS